MSHFVTILFLKRSKATTCLADSTIDRRASSAWVFLQTTTFSQPVYSFQHSSVQLLKGTNKIEKQILELWADSERRTANNMVSKTTFTRVRQATSMVVGWTGESRCQESTVKSVKAKWTISVERERTLSQQKFLYDGNDSTSTADIDRFPRKMSQRTVVEVIKRQKNAKKSRCNGVDAAGTSSALTRLRLTPRFRHFRHHHGNLEKRSCVNSKKT